LSVPCFFAVCLIHHFGVSCSIQSCQTLLACASLRLLGLPH
jgi:hypothetical protein